MLNSPIDEIKSRLDVVDVIGSYLKLQKTGANYRALCPFHSEKKPSFFVSPARQIWHCFGCSAGGDIFKFVMQIEGVEFGDALRILAQKAGVELKKPSPELVKWQTEKTKLYEVCELATQFFEKQLDASSVGNEAKGYLLGRGISKESIKKWRLGYAPDTWQGLSDFLTSRGYKKEEVEKAGLGISSEIGSFYDRFRGRIIFPIFDLNSQVVGFGGRIFKEKNKGEIAKYINTPNTLLYDKSQVIYGLDQAKMAIRKKDFCILVEGYTDVILSSQAGVENVVSSSGTALTSYQLKILKRYSENIYTAFDMDIAGSSATKRGIDLAQAQGFNIKVIIMPEDKDPADIISENQAEWGKLVSNARSILDFYFETAFSKFNPKEVEGKVEISKILLPVVKRIPNKIAKSHWIQELSKRLQVKEEDLETELKKIKTEAKFPIFNEPVEEKKETLGQNIQTRSRKDLLEERIASLVLKYPQHLSLIDKKYFSYFSTDFQKILNYLKQNLDSGHIPPKFSLKIWAGKGLPQKLINFLNDLSFASEVDYNPLEEQFNGEDLPNPEEEIKICLGETENLEIKNELDQISKQIKTAEETHDFKKVESLIQKFNSLSQRLIKT
ncbi:MAG: DNA primase [Candidatus Nealsonbacteria bacterium CG_4_9_14_0_2_um_filter_37_38]|uniref:DNA primase n=1 Tax=Candidatus Nealsonbacteria bacterium CG_4_10_14_0_8_um_filter_37_14 TaxID=1974684 RepID=A0A2M7R5P2_9BACT|nr:MAG: DNA primase [Candidatus Nealsonbacteria bacterium CG11_big_fil_rev_8_21_14_0_20_37_68]PIY88669.1 MAG: DNA primase [Candidatus Nealsonbacteria bacterium CG_4_10_14_0_8_um_filter_37_14]PJC51866.1 MAG: DNA primase [Candidatus Nealsonbacteria bacterium CG_4_9_14_0_2_um_filter_37_38]